MNRVSSTIGAHHALVADDFCVSTLKKVECSEAACDRDMGCVPAERAALVQQLRCRGWQSLYSNHPLPMKYCATARQCFLRFLLRAPPSA